MQIFFLSLSLSPKFGCAAPVSISIGVHYSEASNKLIFFFLFPHLNWSGTQMVAVAWHSMDFMANYFVRGLFAAGWENLLWCCDSTAINRVLPGLCKNEWLQTCIRLCVRIRSRLSWLLFFLVFHFQTVFAVMSIVYSAAKPFTSIIKHYTKRNVEHFRTILFQLDHYTIWIALKCCVCERARARACVCGVLSKPILCHAYTLYTLCRHYGCTRFEFPFCVVCHKTHLSCKLV